MRDLIRASSLLGFDTLCLQLGADPDALLRGARIDPEVAGDVDAYVPYRTIARLFERTAITLDCPDFGLRLADHQGIEILGALALGVRHAPTALVAIDDLRAQLHDYSPAFAIALAPAGPGETLYTFTILLEDLHERTQILELSLAVSLELFRLLLGRGFSPLRAYLPHDAVSPPARYRRAFACPVQFDAPVCGFDLPTAELIRRRQGDDPAVRDLLARYLDLAAAPADASVTVQVRRLIEQALATGHGDLETVAAHLGTHPRTLQRELAAEHTSFAGLRDEVRREQADRFLHDSRRDLGHLATLLGYSEQSTLTRACRRWFGAPPRQLRARYSSRSSRL